MFRKCLVTDLQSSERLKATGLERILFDIVKYGFSGEPFKPPKSARTLLAELISPAHSICNINIRGNKIIHVQAWPSWLN
jgi:hypothetical protein